MPSTHLSLHYHVVFSTKNRLPMITTDWVHDQIGRKKFDWQAGYFGATVSPSQIERVKRYVLNQEDHHKNQSFQDEYLDLLKLSGVEYD